MKEDIYHRPINTHGGSKYIRTIHPVDGIGAPIKVDVYKVLIAFGVTCPGLQQALKKLLCAGLRNKGSRVQDIKEAFDALFRALEEAELEEQPMIDVPCPACARPHTFRITGDKGHCNGCGCKFVKSTAHKCGWALDQATVTEASES